MAGRPLDTRQAWRTGVKLFLASLAAGVVIKLTGLDPKGLLRGLLELARDLFDFLGSALEWALEYVVVGAILVVPLWLAAKGWRRLRGKR